MINILIYSTLRIFYYNDQKQNILYSDQNRILKVFEWIFIEQMKLSYHIIKYKKKIMSLLNINNRLSQHSSRQHYIMQIQKYKFKNQQRPLEQNQINRRSRSLKDLFGDLPVIQNYLQKEKKKKQQTSNSLKKTQYQTTIQRVNNKNHSYKEDSAKNIQKKNEIFDEYLIEDKNRNRSGLIQKDQKFIKNINIRHNYHFEEYNSPSKKYNPINYTSRKSNSRSRDKENIQNTLQNQQNNYDLGPYTECQYYETSSHINPRAQNNELKLSKERQIKTCNSSRQIDTNKRNIQQMMNNKNKPKQVKIIHSSKQIRNHKSSSLSQFNHRNGSLIVKPKVTKINFKLKDKELQRQKIHHKQRSLQAKDLLYTFGI